MRTLVVLFASLSLIACQVDVNTTTTEVVADSTPDVEVTADPAVVVPAVVATPNPIPSFIPSGACNFPSMVINGADSSDVARTNYDCPYDGPAIKVVYVFFSDGTGRIQDGVSGWAAVANTTWVLDNTNCELTISVAGSPIYRIYNPTLNGDSTIASSTFYRYSDASLGSFSGCTLDSSPGQTF
jgi:hypothetical protein